MKRKSMLILLVLLVSFALICSACQSNETPAENPPAAANESTGDEATAEKLPAGQVVIGTWAGTYMELLQKYVDPIVKEMAPDVEIVYVGGQDYEFITKALAEKDGKGTVDVIMMAEAEITKLTNNNLAVKISEENVPNYSHIYDTFRDDYFVPQISSAGVLIYNTEKVNPAPTSWGALWDPQYKGKVGMLETNRYFNMFVGASIAGEEYYRNQRWDEVSWDNLAKLKSDMDLKIYSTQEALGNAMASGEIYMTVGWRARAKTWSENEVGEPIASVLPEEGCYVYLSGAAVLANGQNTEAALVYINAMLDPRAQEGFAKEMGYGPTVDNCELPEDLAAKISISDEEFGRVFRLDPAYIAVNYDAWLDKYNQEFIAK